MLCLDLRRPLYESKLVFGIQVISSDRAVEICMLPHTATCSSGSWPLHHTIVLSTAAACITTVQFEHKIPTMLLCSPSLHECILSHLVLSLMCVSYSVWFRGELLCPLKLIQSPMRGYCHLSDSSCCKAPPLSTKSSLIVFELLQMHATSHPWAEITISAYIGSLKSPKYFPAWLTWKAQWKKEHDPPRKRKWAGLRSA